MLFVVPSRAARDRRCGGSARGQRRAGRCRRVGRPARTRPCRAQAAIRRTPPGIGAGRRWRRSRGAIQLTLDHDVADGPAIGAKTVKRLRALGIETVRDLLKADPAALAVLLDCAPASRRRPSATGRIRRCSCAAFPACEATHAQLLVGAGYRSAEAIAAAEADKLCADVMAFATTPAGQRVLRNGEVPDIEQHQGLAGGRPPRAGGVEVSSGKGQQAMIRGRPAQAQARPPTA